MSTYKIPAEHIARLEAATTEQLRALAADNRRHAIRTAGGCDYAKYQAYVVECKRIIDSRPSADASPKPQPQATAKQVDFAWTLIVRATHTGADLPYDKDSLHAMSRGQISALIANLKEQY